MGYIDVTAQAVTFLLSVVLGVLLCLLYDFFRALNRSYIKGFFEVIVCDLLFWVASAFITYCFLIVFCQGMVRGFVLFGEALGAIATRLTFSRFFIIGLERFFSIISKIFKAIVSFARKMTTPFKKIFKKMQLSVKKVLQPKAILLYNQLKVRILRKDKKQEKEKVVF